jgi:hypothetical protein
MEFYSYLWLRSDGTPYYVGKGHGTRAFTNRSHGVHCPQVSRILIFSMRSEGEAFESEIALIELFGRKDLGTGCLRNRTNGGEGVSGYHHTLGNKQKIGRASAGRKATLGHRWMWTEEARKLFSRKLSNTPTSLRCRQWLKDLLFS